MHSNSIKMIQHSQRQVFKPQFGIAFETIESDEKWFSGNSMQAISTNHCYMEKLMQGRIKKDVYWVFDNHAKNTLH